MGCDQVLMFSWAFSSLSILADERHIERKSAHKFAAFIKVLRGTS